MVLQGHFKIVLFYFLTSPNHFFVNFGKSVALQLLGQPIILCLSLSTHTVQYLLSKHLWVHALQLKFGKCVWILSFTEKYTIVWLVL